MMLETFDNAHMNSIELASINKYIDEKIILRDLTFSFAPGSIYVITGQNGAGKTTLLNLVAGISTCDEGTAILRTPSRTYSICKETISRTLISSFIQNSSCYDYLRVDENLELSLCHNADILTVDEVITLFQLECMRSSLYAQLSEGYKQRVNLAKAFLGSPKWILLDEPTVFLDSESVLVCATTIRQYLEKGSSFIIATHDMDFVSHLDNSVILSLKSGRLHISE